MEGIRIVPAPGAWTRLEARVRYGDRPRRPERVWLEVPEAIADGLDGATGNAFFAAMLPLATVLEQGLAVWTLSVRDDAFEVDRMPKLRVLASQPRALRHLRVCWHSTAGSNCGRCKKCILARVMLDLLGAEHACPGLPRAPDLLLLLRALPVRSGDERSDMSEVHQEAQARGRDDVAAAAAHALSGDPTIRDLVTLRRPRSMRGPWWRRLARAPRTEDRRGDGVRGGPSG